VPAFVVRPVSAEEVQTVVKLAREFRRSFSVRGGGHNYVCTGFKKDSVHLDMRNMTSFSFRSEGGYGFARLGPGLTNGDLEARIPAGFQYAVGTCPSVGVAGYLLHGGSSPRTTWLGNTTLYSIDVVTADGEMLTVSEASPHDGLWTAMRMAGSSFGVATSLTVRLPAKPQRKFTVVPALGSFERLLAALRQPRSDGDWWIGLIRFDLPNPLPIKTWALKISFPGHVQLGSALEGVRRWASEVGIEVDVSKAASTWPPAPPSSVPHAGSSGRFYAEETYEAAALTMHEFFARRTGSCWYDLGPLKGTGEDVFLDISCYTPQAVQGLRQHIDENAAVLNAGAARYYNLPLDGTPREVHWPNYDELAAIKDRWDSSDFFNISNGIHPGSE